MTLTRFVSKNAFRNKRRSILTVLSIAFSLLLLTLMMTLWRSFYMNDGSAESNERLVTPHKVSLTFALPGYYREKIRSVSGVGVLSCKTLRGPIFGKIRTRKARNLSPSVGG